MGIVDSMVNDVNRLKMLSSDEKVSALTSLQSTLSSEINTASSKVGGASYGGWNDDVSTKMSGHSDQLKDDIYPKIAEDVGGGSNLQMLITQVKALHSKCEEFDRVLQTIQSISLSSSLPEKQLNANKARKQRLEGTLAEIYNTDIAGILRNISNIKFLGDAAGMQTEFAEHEIEEEEVPEDTHGGKKFYYFGFAGFYSDNPYILGGGYGVYDSAEDVGEDSSHDEGSSYNQSEYQRAIDEHRDILMSDGAELEFFGGYIWGAIGRDYYNSNSCITLYAYDSSTGRYRRVQSQDADGTNHFNPNDKGRTVEEMRNAKYR